MIKLILKIGTFRLRTDRSDRPVLTNGKRPRNFYALQITRPTIARKSYHVVILHASIKFPPVTEREEQKGKAPVCRLSYSMMFVYIFMFIPR